jgi:hypothetical protein
MMYNMGHRRTGSSMLQTRPAPKSTNLLRRPVAMPDNIAPTQESTPPVKAKNKHGGARIGAGRRSRASKQHVAGCLCTLCATNRLSNRPAKTFEQRRKAKASQWMRSYGITSADYDRMFEAQGGVCAICGKKRRESSWERCAISLLTTAIKQIRCAGFCAMPVIPAWVISPMRLNYCNTLLPIFRSEDLINI